MEFYDHCNRGYIHLFKSDLSGDLWVKQRCSAPWCSRCEPLRAHRIRQQIQDHFGYHNPLFARFVTMSTSTSTVVEGAFNRLQTAWKRITDSKRCPTWAEVTTYFGVREITETEKGFHPHFHMLVGLDRNYWDYAQLHEEWNQSAGESAQFNVINMRSVRGGVKYMGKYMSKDGKDLYWGGLTQLQAFRYAGTLKGRNRILRPRGSSPPKIWKGYCLCCMPATGSRCDRGT